MVFLEYINFEHNTVAAELVRQTYDTPPLAFVHSYGCQQVGILGLIAQAVADIYQHALDALAVVDVLLCA